VNKAAEVFVLFDTGDYYGPDYLSVHATVESAQAAAQAHANQVRGRRVLEWSLEQSGTIEAYPYEIKREALA
jgi:hypothetical protein